MYQDAHRSDDDSKYAKIPFPVLFLHKHIRRPMAINAIPYSLDSAPRAVENPARTEFDTLSSPSAPERKYIVAAIDRAVSPVSCPRKREKKNIDDEINSRTEYIPALED